MIRQNGMVIMSETEYEKISKTDKPSSLKEYANKISELTECGAIREYFDKEVEDKCVCDSFTIFNFFCACEEVCFNISNGYYQDAEDLIKRYYEDIISEDNYEDKYKKLVKFLPKIVAREKQNTDIQLNRKDFLELYGYAMQQMDFVELEDQDDKSEVLVYGNDFTIHYLGYFCNCGDGAAIFNYLIPAIESLNDEENDIFGEEE